VPKIAMEFIVNRSDSGGGSYTGARECTGIPNNFDKIIKNIYDIYMCVLFVLDKFACS